MTIIFKGTRPGHNIVYVQIYIYIQGRIQDLAQGGEGGGQNLRGRGRFCTIYEMSLQENIKKKIFEPPLNHSGGDILAAPPS